MKRTLVITSDKDRQDDKPFWRTTPLPIREGGTGSGDYNHIGRKGEVGGSGPSAGDVRKSFLHNWAYTKGDVKTQYGSSDSIAGAAMIAANRMHGNADMKDVPGYIKASATDEATQFVSDQSKRASSWFDEKHPNGADMYRGLNADEVSKLSNAKIGDTVTFTPLIATSTKAGIGEKYAYLSSPDLLTLGVSSDHLNLHVAKFEGVRGNDVFASQSQEGKDFPSMRGQDEHIMFGNAHAWTLVAHTTTPKDNVTVVHTYTLRAKRGGT